MSKETPEETPKETPEETPEDISVYPVEEPLLNPAEEAKSQNHLFLPPYESFPNLETEELLLRRLTLADVDERMVEIGYFSGEKATTEEEAGVMLEKIEALYTQGELMHWGIFSKETGDLVGSCGFYRGFEGGRGEAGGILRAQYRNQGIMQPAIAAIVTFALDTMGLSEIFAVTSKENPAAQKLLIKLGFVYERDHDEKNLRYVYQA
jgi:ribosomal-protein-alanine N-acetyltransferase